MSKKIKKVSDKILQNSLTKVVFIEKQLLDAEVNELNFVTIKLPRKTSVFMTSSCGKSIFEILQFNEKHRSFFVDNAVCSNGKIYLTTKIDPLFIFIQYLEEHCKTRAQPLEQFMEGSAGMFINVLKSQQMKMIADQKGPDELKAYVYNEEKTVKWLKKKLNLIKKSLREQSIISSGATSMNYVKSSAEIETVDENEIAEAALGIISEYISLDLIEKLDEAFGISEKSKEKVNKRKSEVGGKEGDRKRIKVEEQENLPEVSPPNVKKEAKVTAKSKAMEKAAKGSKSINSFFTKK